MIFYEEKWVKDLSHNSQDHWYMDHHAIRAVCGHRRDLTGICSEQTFEPTKDVCPKCLKIYRKKHGFQLSVIFEPCDLWVGFFWDKQRRILYFMPIPCLGLKIQFKTASR